MGKTSSSSKQQWNKENYTQFNVWLKPEVLAAFKVGCADNNVSMRSEISRLMSDQCSESIAQKKPAFRVDTRQQRRKTLRRLIQEIEAIKDAEKRYQSRIPENLQASSNYEAAEQTIAALEEAIDLLAGAFD